MRIQPALLSNSLRPHRVGVHIRTGSGRIQQLQCRALAKEPVRSVEEHYNYSGGHKMGARARPSFQKSRLHRQVGKRESSTGTSLELLSPMRSVSWMYLSRLNKFPSADQETCQTCANLLGPTNSLKSLWVPP